MVQAQAVRVPLGARLTIRQKLLVMYALMMTMFLTALDQSIVATAIPHILADLGGFSLFAWVFTVYLLASTVTIPIVGKLSDMFGRRPYLIAGISIFVLSSAACGAAPSMLFLIAARGVQGIGSGIIIACVFATLGDLFTPIERAKYFALFTGMFTFASLAGPTAGGFLTDGPGWRWCFYINLPFGVIATALIATRLPRGGGSGGRASEVDFLGALLLTVATISFMLGIVWGSKQFGWGSPQTGGLFALAVVLTVLFILNERHHPHAIIPLKLFKNVPLVQSISITVLASAGIFSATQYLPTFVQTSLGGSATASGLVITPQALGLLATSTLSGQVIARSGKYKWPIVIGAAAIAVAAFLLHNVHAGEPTWHLAVFMVLMGLGSGMVFPVSQVIVQAAVSQDEQGVAASTRQFFLQIAQVFGVGVFGLLLTTSYISTFVRDTRGIEASMPPAVYEQFKDPTLALDAPRFAQVSDQLRQQPNGEATLARAQQAQRNAVADAIQRIFTVSMLAGLGVLAIALSLRQIPLRRSFDAENEAIPVVELP